MILVNEESSNLQPAGETDDWIFQDINFKLVFDSIFIVIDMC